MTPWVDAMLTIAPGRLAPIRWRPICWLRKNAPFKFTPMTSSHSASVTSTAARVSGTPALFTSTSSCPQAASTSVTARSMLASDRTSSVTGIARRPVAVMARTVSARSAGRRSEMATSQPSRASASAPAAPIPYEAPVTNAVRVPPGPSVGIVPPHGAATPAVSRRGSRRPHDPRRPAVRRGQSYLSVRCVRSLEQERARGNQSDREQLLPAERFPEEDKSDEQHQQRRGAANHERRGHLEPTRIRQQGEQIDGRGRHADDHQRYGAFPGETERRSGCPDRQSQRYVDEEGDAGDDGRAERGGSPGRSQPSGDDVRGHRDTRPDCIPEREIGHAGLPVLPDQ